MRIIELFKQAIDIVANFFAVTMLSMLISRSPAHRSEAIPGSQERFSAVEIRPETRRNTAMDIKKGSSAAYSNSVRSKSPKEPYLLNDPAKPSNNPAMSPSNSSSAASLANAATILRQKPTLLNIPPEIRNKIFSLVYQPAFSKHPWASNEWVEISNIHPSVDSIIPCRQLHSEYKSMYLHAYREYWHNGQMSMTIPRSLPIKSAVRKLFDPSVDIRHLRALKIAGWSSGGRHTFLFLEYVQGYWEIEIIREDAKGERLRPLLVAEAVIDSVLKHLGAKGKIGNPAQGRGLTPKRVKAIMNIVLTK